MDKKTDLVLINEEVNLQLANAEVVKSLAATVFKNLKPEVMKQAITEGMIRGFKFKDFLEKNVYAIPYGAGYSLITSIDYSRKQAMRSGLAGKNEPKYVEKDSKIITCSVTVKKINQGIVGDYTATVYFDEYYKKGGLWDSKPHTMIAKVAEMHALRMAFPEELSQAYVEEEMQKEVVKTPAPADKPVNVKAQIVGQLKTLGEVMKTKEDIAAAIKKHTQLDAIGDDKHFQEITDRLSVLIKEKENAK